MLPGSASASHSGSDMSRISSLAVAALILVAACDTGGKDVVAVDATGDVGGLVWLDHNGNTTLDASDGPVRDVTVQLVPRGGTRVAYSAQSGPNGQFLLQDVLVGDYEARLDESTIGDTLRVLRIDSADVTVAAGDTAVVVAALTYPALPIDSLRGRPLDSRVFVDGLALTRWNTYGDQSLNVRDSTGAVLAVRVQATAVIPGDSVRVTGTTTIQTGQVVLKDASVFLLRTGVESPAPDTISTGTAANAGSGGFGADLVYLDSAVVRETSVNSAGDFVLTVGDGSGDVDVVLDRDISFLQHFDTGVIGTILHVTGILFPASVSGPWVVKPRSSEDIVVGPLS